MNLVVLTKQFGNYTGATVSTIEILKRVSKQFDTIDVITMKAENIDISNVNIVIAANYFELIKILKEKKRVGKVCGYSDDHLGFLFSFFGIKYVHTYHGNWPDVRWLNINMFLKSLFFIPMYKLTIKKADQVISVSKYMNDKFVKKYSRHTTVIYNGIKQVNNCESSFNAKNKFLMVGNVDSRKYGEAIKVFTLLKAKDFNDKIDIYGSILDKRVAKKLGKMPFVELEGSRSNIDYTKYDALLCTSISENLPVSIVEAILSGIPVISFNVGGIKEVVTDNVTGKLIFPKDVIDFAKTVKTFKKYIITEEVRKYLNYKFNWDYSAKKYLNLLNNERNSK